MTRHLYQNSEVIYCAESLDEANRLFASDMGETPQEMDDEFEQLPDDKVLEVGSEEPSGAAGEVCRGGYYYEKKTCAEWAATRAESGHFSGGDS